MKINEIENLDPGQKVNIGSTYKEIGHYIDLIKTNCSEVLPIIKTAGFLYRGIGHVSDLPLAYQGRSREDRRSLAGNGYEQRVFNKIITQYGFKANRANSIFCSGDVEQAAVYGKTYIVFPINGFNFLWSTKLRDFMYHSDQFSEAAINAMQSADRERLIPAVIKHFGYRDDDLSSAIIAQKEILINGSYYAFESKSFADALTEYL